MGERRQELKEAKEVLARSVSLPAEERRKTLRELQVRWHPDKQVDVDDESRAFALELMQMINKQATIAKSNAAEIGALKRRQDAFAQLERAMPAVLFGRVMSST